MSSIEDKLKELGITLPEVPKPLGSYIPALISGKLLFLSGMLPLKDGRLMFTGKVGAGVSAEEGRICARQAAINALAVAKSQLGALGSIVRVIKITGYVASATDFAGQPGVLNGASELMVEVFGEAGRHVRVAVGVAVLPLDSPVEIEFVFEVIPA